jgi:hypothetical protein
MELTPISSLIHVIRGQRVMLASDLAKLYGVPTKSLNLAVKRNLERFPADFMFVLTAKEALLLRFQIETSKIGRGGSRYLPRVFTEHGVAMLSSVLGSENAVRVNIEIIRAFIRLRHALASNRELAKRLDQIEQSLQEHDAALGQQGEEIRQVFEDLRNLMEPSSRGRRIGFLARGD